MSTTTEAPSTEARRDALIDRLLGNTQGMFEIYSIHLGNRLGLYDALAADGPQNAAELAARTSTHPRYVREWLEQQAVSGLVDVAEASAADEERRYALPEAHREVLVEKDSLNYVAPLAQVGVGALQPIERVIDCYRTGAGLEFHEFGHDMCLGQSGMNRMMFLELLGKEWLPSIPDVHARLSSDAPSRIADIGCGTGYSSLGMAKAYPNAQVDGFDLDAESIRAAQRSAAASPEGGRVSFRCADAGSLDVDGTYQLVTAFECVHDMPDPVSVLRTMRELCAEDGAVVIMDENVGEQFSLQASDVEKLFYGFSVFHCLPCGMCGDDPVGTGTVMRPGTLEKYAKAAGFSAVENLDIENFFFRFYRLIP